MDRHVERTVGRFNIKLGTWERGLGWRSIVDTRH